MKVAAIAIAVILGVLMGLMFLDQQRSNGPTGPAQSVPTSQPAPDRSTSTTSSSASYFVQLDSTSDESDLRNIVQRDIDRWASIVGIPLETYKVTQSNGSVFYRVGRTVSTKQEADAECSSIKAKGGDCLSLTFGG